MSSGSSNKPTNLDEVYAEAYRSYLRSLKEGLANLDVDALDLSGIRAPSHITLGTPTPSGIFTFAGFTFGSTPTASGFTFGSTPTASGFTFGSAPASESAAATSEPSAPSSDDQSS